MARGLFITGTDVGVGKTLVGCALAFAAHARGMRVGVMKPIETGCREVAGVLASADARGLAYAAASDFPIGNLDPSNRQLNTVAPTPLSGHFEGRHLLWAVGSSGH